MDRRTPTHRRTSLTGTVLRAPWGPIHLAVTEVGVIAVELLSSPEDFQAGVEQRAGCAMTWASDPAPVTDAADRTEAADPLRHLRAAVAALTAALDGDGRGLDALPLDLADRPEWDRAVLGAVRAIPRGETRSYGDIARAIGRIGAARAVGGAVGRNPIGYVIPCHRVIAADGTLGGYGGGWWGDRDRLLDLKADLLAREGRTVRRRISDPKCDR